MCLNTSQINFQTTQLSSCRWRNESIFIKRRPLWASFDLLFGNQNYLLLRGVIIRADLDGANEFAVFVVVEIAP